MTANGFLTKDAFLGLAGTKIVEVDLGDGHKVYVRTLTAYERDQYEASMFDKEGELDASKMVGLRARLTVFALCDENGKRLLKNDDTEAVNALPAYIVDRIFDVAQAINGMKEDNEKLKELLKKVG